MRRLKITAADVAAIIANPDTTDVGGNGNTRHIGYADAKRIRIVVARDDHDLVVSVHERKR